MRKSFDGLQVLVQQVFQLDPLEGHLFLFVNRRRDRVKILWWDRDGLALFYKRLEAGTYQLPVVAADAQGVEIDATQLALLLGGIDLRSARRRKRYSRVA
jgi:transposase